MKRVTGALGTGMSRQQLQIIQQVLRDMAATRTETTDISTRLAVRAAAADVTVTVTVEVTAGAPHVFQAFAGQLDEADAALASAGAFIRRYLCGNGGPRHHG
jgi:uncharacterized protein YaaQ